MKRTLRMVLAAVMIAAGCDTMEPEPFDLAGSWDGDLGESMVMHVTHEVGTGTVTGEVVVQATAEDGTTRSATGPVEGTLTGSTSLTMYLTAWDVRLVYFGEVKDEDTITGTFLHPDGDDHRRLMFVRR